MKLLVTGASGFLGRYVAAEALRRGHAVRAMARSAAKASEAGLAAGAGDGRLEAVQADLRSRRGLIEAAAGVDAVIHLAAAKAGDVYEQYGGTVVATENLLWAMQQAGVKRIVHVSSFSVYDYMKMREWSLLDESAPVERDAFERDGYAHTKLVQENLVRHHAQDGWAFTILRPGAIYGKDNLWTARCGSQLGKRLWVRTGAWARQPLTYVENCAEAIVLAAEKDAAIGQTLNVVDDDAPSQRAYVNALRRRHSPKPLVIPVSWTVMRSLARMAWLTNKFLLGNRAKVPGLLIPCRLHARLKPLRFTNQKIKDVLGWRPKYSLEEAIDLSMGRSAAGSDGSDGNAHARGRQIPDGGPDETPHRLPTEAVTEPVQASRPADLRIAYMTGQYPRATDTFIQREVAALRDSGVHVQTLSVRKPADKENVGPETQGERERTFYLLPANGFRLAGTHLGLLARHPGRYFSAMKLALSTRPPGLKALVWQAAYFVEAGLVARRMRESTLSHLHNHFSNSSCSVAMLASALGGFTYSFTMHGPSEFFEPHYWRVGDKVKRAKFVNCISQFCRSQAMVFAPQEKWDKLHVVHCGVTPDDFTPVRHLGEGVRLLFVGRLAAVKGLPVLLEALAELKRARPDVRLTVAGDGPDREELAARAKKLGVESNVVFLGYQSQAQVRQLLQQTDVFTMASFAEGVPVVLMEAMAAGVPVVATRIAGIPELVEDGVSGFLVPPADANSLAEKVAALLADAGLRSRFGAAGRSKVEKDFNIATEADRLCRIMTSALQGVATSAAKQGAASPAGSQRVQPQTPQPAAARGEVAVGI